MKYFRVFGSKCYILSDRENLGKFDAKSDEGIFLGYFTNSRAYRVFNKRTKTVMESINVEVDDAITKVEMVDDGEGPSSKKLTTEGEAQDIEVKGSTLEKESTPVNSRLEARSMSRTSSPLTPLEVHPPISRNDEVSTTKKPSSRVIKNHPGSNIIGSLDEGLRLRKGNYSALMTIESLEDLNLLVQELGEHSDEESMGVVEKSDAEKDESTTSLQENYNSLLEKSGKYARVAMAAMKKMKKADEDYKSLLVCYKEARCEIETLNGELTEAYTKVKFL